ncbi:MAG: DUF2752 domain-containing protein [Myxococcales bacterium]|nr:DUF2752 domain-containing protein [Myxococcales bacterium]
MRLRWPAPNRSFGFLDALGVTGAVAFLVARFVPVDRIPFWGCALRKATGWPCLGCGLTRAFQRLARGEVLGALDANPLGALCAAALFGISLLALLHLAFRLPVPELSLEPRQARRVRIGLGVALALNYAFVLLRTRFSGLS